MIRNRSAPGSHVVPVLVYEDVGAAVAWLRHTFGFQERLRVAGREGVVYHAQMWIAEQAIMLGKQGAEFHAPRSGEVTQYVIAHVDDVDAHHEQSKARGANVTSPPSNMPFGERQYSVIDPGGHKWTFSQSVADMPLDAWGATPAT